MSTSQMSISSSSNQLFNIRIALYLFSLFVSIKSSRSHRLFHHGHQHIHHHPPLPRRLITNLPLCCACLEVTPGIPGCQSDQECEFLVCSRDEYCCGAQWDAQCVENNARPICNANTLSPTTRNPTSNPTPIPTVPTPIVSSTTKSPYWLNAGIMYYLAYFCNCYKYYNYFCSRT